MPGARNKIKEACICLRTLTRDRAMLNKEERRSATRNFAERGNLVLILLWIFVPAGVVLSAFMPLSPEVRTFAIPTALEFLVSGVVAFLSVIWALVLAFSAYWLQAVTAILGAFLLTLPLLATFGVATSIYQKTWGALDRANKSLTFAMLKAQYDQEIGSRPKGHAPIRLFVWHEDSEGGYGIAFDPTGKLATHAARLPPSSTNPQNFSRGLCSINSIAPDYYFVSFGCNSPPDELRRAKH